MVDLALFYPEGHEAHAMPGHPERPERVEVIRTALQQAGWWDSFPRLDPQEISSAVMQTVHYQEYLFQLEAICRHGMALDINTYTTPASWTLAHSAAGGAVAVARAVWRGEAQRGFALTRPPGHHATHERGGGFCLLNNIALATESLIQQEEAKRLAIVDLDLHHGNGTQDIFWRRGDVLYISTHQVPLFPGTGWLDETGAGPGEGATANFPLSSGSGDRAFQTVMDELILPLLDRFSPEMILVSYGFDAHWREAILHAGLLLSATVYGELIARLTRWADEHCRGRIALFLEGGYDLEAAADCTLAVTAALLGQPWQDRLGRSPDPERSDWRSMVQQARKMWRI
jgi:acetoin utilization deacetylase AcuC-like enzyme